MSSQRQRASPAIPPCDQCLCRKIRCDKSLPRCQRCLSADLSCTREVVRRRPGRKKGSGLVIERLRINNLAGSAGAVSPTLRNTNRQYQPPLSRDLRPPVAEDQPQEVDLESRLESRLEDDAARRGSPTATLAGHALHPSEGVIVEPWPPRIDLSPAACHDSPTSRSTIERAVAIIAGVANLPQYIDHFFTELYPIWPIVPEASFRKSLLRLGDLDLHQSCLILSICALSALHIPESTLHEEEPRRMIADRFIRQCLQLRTTFDYIGTANIVAIQTSLFLSCAQVEFQRARAAWFLLFEAIMLAQELGYYDKPQSQSSSSSPPVSLQVLSPEALLSVHRTLYLLSLTERGLTVLRNKPFAISIFDSPLPERFEDEDPRVLYGLQSLSLLFSLLDKPFLDTWINTSKNNTAAETSPTTEPHVITSLRAPEVGPSLVAEAATSRILSAQHALSSTRFLITSLTDVQKADILITQQWLRLVFWQASMRQGLLSSAADEPALSYDFPCEIAKALSAVLEKVPRRAMIIHGMAIFERIFEIAYSFIDSLSLSHSLTSEQHLAELRVLFRVLRDSPNSHQTYIQILETKFVEQGGAEGTEPELISLLYGRPKREGNLEG